MLLLARAGIGKGVLDSHLYGVFITIDMHLMDILYACPYAEQFSTVRWNKGFYKASERILKHPDFKGLKVLPDRSLDSDTRPP